LFQIECHLGTLFFTFKIYNNMKNLLITLVQLLSRRLTQKEELPISYEAKQAYFHERNRLECNKYLSSFMSV